METASVRSNSFLASVGAALLLAQWGCAATDPSPDLMQYYGQGSAIRATTSGTGGAPAAETGGAPAVQGGAVMTTTGGVPSATGGAIMTTTGGTVVAMTGGVQTATGGAVVVSTGGVIAGTGGVPPATGGVVSSGSTTTMTINFTTKTLNGQYAPKNVGAVWIEDSSGKWIYTTDYWNSQLNSGKLSTYAGVGGPAYCKDLFGINWVTQPPPDVVTSATLNGHQAHSSAWPLTDANGAPVPDGTYHLKIEMTEDDSAGATADFEFTKGPDPFSLTPADTNPVTGVKIELK